MDGKISFGSEGKSGSRPWTTASELRMFVGISTCFLVGTLLFYGFVYSLHQDLAGSALSGSLAISLGESFRDYSIYFPPAEKLWFSFLAYLSNHTGLRLDLTAVLLTNLAMLFSAGLGFQIRRTAVGTSPLFFLSSLAVLIILPILFKNIFGLREHMVVAGIWPYLVLRLSDPGGKLIGSRLRLVVGLWLGMMLLFKYLYSIIVILVELADSLYERKPAMLFRLENLVAGLIVFLYLVGWLGIDSSQREAIGFMRSSIDANLIDGGESLVKFGENIILAILLLGASYASGVSKRSIATFFAVVLATLFVAWVQSRWYTHHLFPILMAYIAWWWYGAKQFQRHINLAVMALVLFAVGIQFLDTRIYQNQVRELELALENDGRSVMGKRVALLTMHPSPYNQYLASHGALRWNPMMNNAYVSAELKPFDKEDAKGKPPPVELDDPGREMLHDQMLRLWEDQPPDVLILDGTHRWPLRYIEVDWRHIFSKDIRFRNILKNYRPVLVHNGQYIKFTYYVRTD